MKYAWILLAALTGCSAKVAPEFSANESGHPRAPSGIPFIAVRGQRSTPDLSTLGSLEPGDTLRSGDLFCLFVRLNKPAYVYVAQFYPNGERRILSPDGPAVITETREEVRVPTDPEVWLQLDNATGIEHLYVIASLTPLEQSSGDVARAIRAIRTSRKSAAGEDHQGSQPSPVPPATLPTAPSSPSSIPAARPEQLGPYELLKSKGVNTVRIGPRGVAVLSAPARDGDAGVLHFSFIHE